ncbi:MAG: DUF447 domain-containing protein [Burkholderiales bacterium]|jgi:hypothetical protein
MSNHFIREVIVTTQSADGQAHIAPMGVWEEDGLITLAPFRPSRTLDNVLARSVAVVNACDDVRVFAGCLTGRHDWPLVAGTMAGTLRLQDAVSHQELELVRIDEDAQRPKLRCRVALEQAHRVFAGFNRARAAVLECAILASRLHMLPAEKIRNELAYLAIAIDKTAGPAEREAWGWLREKIDAHLAGTEGTPP